MATHTEPPEVARSRRDDPEDRPLADRDDEWVVPTDERLRQARRPEELGDLLEGLVSSRGWAARLRSTAVFNRWDELVGPELARRCEPVRLAGGVLVVRAENASWAAQVRYLSGTVRRRAREVLDQPVERIEIEVGPLQGTAGRDDDRT